MSEMDKERCIEAINRVADMLCTEFKELSTAEHVFVLTMSIQTIAHIVLQDDGEHDDAD
jgi:hypothetical protein